MRKPSYTAGQRKNRILKQSRKGSRGNVLGKVSGKTRRKSNRDMKYIRKGT